MLSLSQKTNTLHEYLLIVRPIMSPPNYLKSWEHCRRNQSQNSVKANGSWQINCSLHQQSEREKFQPLIFVPISIWFLIFKRFKLLLQAIVMSRSQERKINSKNSKMVRIQIPTTSIKKGTYFNMLLRTYNSVLLEIYPFWNSTMMLSHFRGECD